MSTLGPIPPLPTPFPIPMAPVTQTLNVDSLWDYNTIIEALSFAQTIPVLADMNGLIGVVSWTSVILMVVYFLLRFVSARGEDI